MLATQEGEKKMFRLAKIIEKRSRDFKNVYCIKSEKKSV